MILLTELVLRFITVHDEFFFESKLSSFDEVFLRNSTNFYFSNSFAPVPFMGVAYNSTLSHINNRGLNKASVDIKENNCRIGVFGGSVAEQLTFYWEKNQEKHSLEAERAFKNCHGRKISILNFAGGTLKQPQQFIAFTAYGLDLDVTINLDGFNEIFLDPGEKHPAFYPYFMDEMYNLTKDKADIIQKIRRIHLIEKKLVSIGISTPLLRSSVLYIKSYEVFKAYANSKKKEYKSKIKSSNPSYTKKRKVEEVDEWGRFTSLQSTIARKRGVESYFFIQPNLYVTDTKPLTVGEAVLVKNKEEKITFLLNFGYRLLRDKSKVLKTVEEVNVFDLSNVFKSTLEDIYVDECCHVNNLGNSLMLTRVLKEIEEQQRK